MHRGEISPAWRKPWTGPYFTILWQDSLAMLWSEIIAPLRFTWLYPQVSLHYSWLAVGTRYLGACEISSHNTRRRPLVSFASGTADACQLIRNSKTSLPRDSFHPLVAAIHLPYRLQRYLDVVPMGKLIRLELFSLLHMLTKCILLCAL